MDNNFDLRKLQKTEIEILDEIDRICRENHIRYYLADGTLLGAVRHSGFIPWDDDIDLAMPRSDYEKFISVCPKELSDEYYLYDIHYDRNYWLPFIKVAKKFTVFKSEDLADCGCQTGIYVDIFPMDDAKVMDSKSKKFLTRIIKIFSALFVYKRGYYKTHDCKPFTRFVFALAALFPMRFLHKIQTKLMKCQNHDTSEYYVVYADNYDALKETFPKKIFEPATQIRFEDKYYPAPADAAYYLNRVYGDDYMELPPIEKRITHNPVEINFDTRQQP